MIENRAPTGYGYSLTQVARILPVSESAEENARLLAAAPDLLAALQALLPIAARVIQGTTDGEPMLKQARAAIARATSKD
jgi:glycerol-3-phosphate dehydrogenase